MLVVLNGAIMYNLEECKLIREFFDFSGNEKIGESSL
jgi:hypothetical protein